MDPLTPHSTAAPFSSTGDATRLAAHPFMQQSCRGQVNNPSTPSEIGLYKGAIECMTHSNHHHHHHQQSVSQSGSQAGWLAGSWHGFSVLSTGSTPQRQPESSRCQGYLCIVGKQALPHLLRVPSRVPLDPSTFTAP